MIQLAGDELVYRRVDAGSALAERVGQLAEGLELHRLDPDREVGETLAHQRIVGGGLAAAPPRARELDQVLEEQLGARGGRQHVALVEERGVRHRPAVVELPDEVRARDAHVLEEHLVEPGVAGHLHERAHGDARGLHVDQDVGDAAMFRRVGIGADEAEHPVGVLRARGPDLLAVHHELVADDLRARAQGGQVGARAGLGVSLAPISSAFRIFGR